eukprot:scaffold570329_cov36-Prasinocladus_malaysianus.AAC.1
MLVRAEWEEDMREAVMGLLNERQVIADAAYGLLHELAFSDEQDPKLKPKRFSTLALALSDVLRDEIVSEEVFRSLQLDLSACIDAMLRSFAAQYEPTLVPKATAAGSQGRQMDEQKHLKAVTTLCAKAIVRHVVLPLTRMRSSDQGLCKLKTMLMQHGTEEQLMKEDVAGTRAG